MSERPAPPRPRQVTMAGWVGGAASLLLLASVFTLMPKLRTVDTRASIRDYLTKGSGKALGIDLDQALVLARVGLFVTGAAAAATLVLAVFVMRRDARSRVAISIAALPILVCGVFVDPFLSGFVLASIVLLWTRPASDWFAGRAPRPAAAMPGPRRWPSTLERPPDAAPPDASSGTGESPTPPPYAAYGTTAPTASAYLAPGAASPGSWSPPRPAAVVTACVVTWVASSLVAVLAVVVMVAASTDEVRNELDRQFADNANLHQLGWSIDTLVVAAQVMCALGALWALLAAGAAVLAFLGHQWARVTLVVSAAVSGLLSLAMGIGLPVLFLVTAAAAAVVVLLVRPDVSRWYAARRRPTPPPVGPPSGHW